MQELIRLIEQEKKEIQNREEFYQKITKAEYKCKHRTAVLLHWSKFGKITLSGFDSIEKQIEKRVEILYEQYKYSPEKMFELTTVFRNRLNNILSFMEREKKWWYDGHQNIQKELDDDIEEYRRELNFLRIKEFAIEDDKRELSKTC